MPSSSPKNAVETKTDIITSPFVITAMIICSLAYIDFFNLFASSSLRTENYAKYPYFAWALSSYGYMAITSKRWLLGLNAQNMLLFLAFFALIAFAWQLINGLEPNSYASAFASIMVYATSGVFDTTKYSKRTDNLRAKIQHLLLVLCSLYVLELLVRRFSGIVYFDLPANETNHIKSLVFVLALCFTYLERDKIALRKTLILLAASLILRPSSTLLIAVAICLPLTVAITRGHFLFAERFTYLVVVISAAIPIIFYSIPNAENLILYGEAWIKEDFLQGRSNSFVRIAIQNAAFERIRDSSLLLGELFSTSNTVQISHILPWWKENNALGLATIHSDYVTILLESGIIGYIWFTSALLLAVRQSFSFVRSAARDGSNWSLPAICHTAVLIVVIYSSSNPFLQYFSASHGVWLIMGLGVIGSRIDQENNL